MAPSRPFKLTVLFGGRSAEHEISLRSARAVVDHLPKDRIQLHLVGIDRDGGWLSEEASARLLAGDQPGEEGGAPWLPEGTDCVFPVLHGPGGEDGTVQGWLELLDVPFVGSGSTACAAAMDKSLTKSVLRDAQVRMLSWSEFRRDQWQADREAVLAEVARDRGFPCFVKPVALGSSVGISRVADADELPAALELAFRYGERLMVEPAVRGREYEIAVLGGAEPLVSGLGAIRPRGWYDYEAKYLADDAELIVPANDLPPRMAASMRATALQVFRALRMEGLARVDFLLDEKTGLMYFNEVNAIPGFTSISMYPRLMAEAGVPFGELTERLVDDALRRAGRSERLFQAEDRAPGLAEFRSLQG